LHCTISAWRTEWLRRTIWITPAAGRTQCSNLLWNRLTLGTLTALWYRHYNLWT
jgi:hypothetical protein